MEAERSGNLGKARTSARRAVGIAIEEMQKKLPRTQYGRDFISSIRGIALDTEVPEEVRKAADRLQTRLTPKFDSPSTNPIEDARIIIRFVVERLTREL
jgi:uncharacterized protein (UPF0147 family)